MIVKRSVNSTDLIVECDQSLKPAAEDVVKKLESLHREGLALHDGVRIRFGWSVLTLRAEDHSLRVCEPAFDRDPFHDVNPTIDVTLRVLVSQVRVLKRVGESGTDGSFEEFLLVRNGALEAPSIFLRRQNRASDQDSGWFAGDLDHIESAGGDLTPIRVYELLDRQIGRAACRGRVQSSAVAVS